MRTISGLLQIIGLVVVVSAGYWVWYSGWGPNPKDPVAAYVGPYLPAPFKAWGCGKLNQRFGAESPTYCSVAASAVPGPDATPNSAPANPSNPEGGRL